MPRLFARARRFFAGLKPPEVAWIGASRVLYSLAAILALAAIWHFALVDFTWGRAAALAVMLTLLFLLGLLARGIWALLAALPGVYRNALLLTSPLLIFLLMPAAGTKGSVLLVLGLALGGGLVGGVMLLLRRRGRGRLRRWRMALSLGLGVGIVAFLVGMVFFPRFLGLTEERNALLEAAERQDRTLPLEDPAATGPFGFETLSYGSGEDRHRPEYGAEVDVRARSVDGSKLVDGWEGLTGKWRTHYWGFDAEALPLQGRAWMPEGEGPFPLVLLVHGNHAMEDFSDVGYAYLGELLASRGTIFVSVDENFLNSSIADLLTGPDGGLDEENDLRGWLMLEHVRQWQDWNAEAGHRFEGKVNLDRVVLMGHSRGGEAVATAAAFHRLGRYPDDARVRFEYDFELRGVVAIAPVDGQYRPRERFTPLVDVSYFVIHGSLDGDVSSFMGTSVYERARFTGPRIDPATGEAEPRFKASLYVVGANHGQFNTSWGECDSPSLWCWALDTGALIPGEHQRRVAQVYLSAFVETLLHGREGYRALFRDPRHGAAWLPEVPLLANYAQSGERMLADYEEDLDPATATHPGARIEGRHLSRWRELWPKLKWNPLDTHLALLAWDSRYRDPGDVDEAAPQVEAGEESTSDPPSYTLRLPAPLDAGADAELVFALAPSQASTLPDDWQEEEGEGEEDGTDEGEEAAEEESDDEEPLDFTLELVDAAGAVARLPLSHDRPLYPAVDSQPKRLALLSGSAGEEILLQRYALPLEGFTDADPGFDPTQLVAIRLLFDRSEKGALLLDALRLSPGPRPRPSEAPETGVGSGEGADDLSTAVEEAKSR